MVYGVVMNVRKAMAQRGGMWGLLKHMYTNGDYPLKFGRLVGEDKGGNKYYENTVDYPFGQHRWVEPYDIHNYDPSSIPPEWHSWMHSMTDVPGNEGDTSDYFEEKYAKDVRQILAKSDAIYDTSIGQTNPPPSNTVNNLHNLSQLRARGWGVGNPNFYMDPKKPDQYYTQPGSAYNGAQQKYVDDIMAGKGEKKKAEPKSPLTEKEEEAMKQWMS
mmetsp:Transcript_14036/g.27992  ORF Transcript_14036/g.27992 Transcript_14036/m.27992 type:complete len:216 (+) Transcript_14036:58-705(+)